MRVLVRNTRPFVSFWKNPAFQTHAGPAPAARRPPLAHPAAAVQRALRYLDENTLPPSFQWQSWDAACAMRVGRCGLPLPAHAGMPAWRAGDERVALTSDDSGASDAEAECGRGPGSHGGPALLPRVSGRAWRPDPAAERSFRRHYEHFCAARGTPLKRTPMLGNRDLDLFRLYTLVALEGGHEQVRRCLAVCRPPGAHACMLARNGR